MKPEQREREREQLTEIAATSLKPKARVREETEGRGRQCKIRKKTNIKGLSYENKYCFVKCTEETEVLPARLVSLRQLSQAKRKKQNVGKK